jgi:hypothetical protein
MAKHTEPKRYTFFHITKKEAALLIAAIGFFLFGAKLDRSSRSSRSSLEPSLAHNKGFSELLGNCRNLTKILLHDAFT